MHESLEHCRADTRLAEMLDAIAAQDAEAARAAMRTHLSNSRERRRKAQAAHTAG